MKNQKAKDWLKGIILIAILFLVVGFGLISYERMQNKRNKPVNVAVINDKIDKYGYTLNNNATAYYQQEFDNLKSLADSNGNDEEIAKQVAKLFVIDLYSMNYKVNKYEVTSAQYFYSDKQDMHKQKVIDKLYNLMEDNTYGDRKQSLPEVTNVTINSSTKSTYALSDKNKVDSYIIDLTITYKEDLGYDTDVLITMVKDSNNINMSVVNMQKK
jgi:hypothetical protein